MYIKNIIKDIFFYKFLNKVYNSIIYIIVRKNFARKISSIRRLKIVIGASNTEYKGWISTNKNLLDITDIFSFKKILKYETVDNFLAEHVFEHLTKEQGKLSTDNFYKFLKISGVLRIAVPDGFFPNREYINSTKPGGYGAGAYDHKVLYNYISIKKIFDQNKFKINYLEYFDEYGKFHKKKLSTRNGFIIRSKYNDKRNRNGKINYTSLIIDAVKI